MIVFTAALFCTDGGSEVGFIKFYQSMPQVCTVDLISRVFYVTVLFYYQKPETTLRVFDRNVCHTLLVTMATACLLFSTGVLHCAWKGRLVYG